jgi:hypothetical protein
MTKQTSLFELSSVKRIKQHEAIQLITEPWLRKNWCFRHLFIGYSGSGKSNAMLVMNEYLKKRGIVCIATDQKSRVSKYDTNVVRTVDDLPSVAARSCVIRGFAASHRMEDRLDYDELARRIFVIGHSGERVCLVIDELSDAAAGAKSFAKPPGAKRLSWMDVLYRQGRELGVSLLLGTQLPQEIPRCAFSLSDTLSFFRQCGHEARYYNKEVNILSEDEVKLLAELDEYEMLLVRKGDPQRYRCKFEEM